MKITIFNGYYLQRVFENAGRGNYYSMCGYDTLLDYYDEIDENMKCDVCAICGDCTEYGEECLLSFDNFISDYSYIYPFDDFIADYEISDENRNTDETKTEYIDALCKNLETWTTVLRPVNGNIIVFSF